MNTAVLAAIICSALSGEQPAYGGSAPHVQAPKTQAENDTDAIRKAIKPNDFNDALRIAARSYKNWPRVSDSAYFAPTLCTTPPRVGALWSQSKDEDTHGKKLYHLYTNRSAEYGYGLWDAVDPAGPRAPATFSPGMVVVKETWTAEEVDRARVPNEQSKGRALPSYPPEYHVTATKAWKMGEQRDLFIMLRTDDTKMEGTDQGWVYAVVSKDGEEIRSASRIDSCMGCHKEAKFERLFGPEWAREELVRK